MGNSQTFEEVSWYAHGLVTAVDTHAAILEYRHLDVIGVIDYTYTNDLMASRADIATEDDIEEFFPLDRGMLGDVKCVDPNNIIPGRLLVCYAIKQMVPLRLSDDPNHIGKYALWRNELWLSGMACEPEAVPQFLEASLAEKSNS